MRNTEIAEDESFAPLNTRLHRAVTDPVVVHKYTRQWAPPEDHNVYADIRCARLKLARNTKVDEHISRATVPETVVYLTTATMDSSYATPELVNIYQHAYRDYLSTFKKVELDNLPSPLNEDPELTEYEQDMYERIREAIKTDRDQWFIQYRYDELDIGLPKSFWDNTADTGTEEELDATVRSVIEEE